MEFPDILREEIAKRTDGLSVQFMKDTVHKLTERYKNSSGRGQSLICSEEEAVVYSAVRMPATFGAVSSALSYTLELWRETIDSVIDAGAGTGAASWAFNELTGASGYVCIENEPAMRKIGKKFMSKSVPSLESATWIERNIVTDRIYERADAVVASYVLNELNPCNIDIVSDKLWDAAEKLLLIVEPGTPCGFRVIKRVRERLLDRGAHIIAPCTCNRCTMDDNDWCHFTCRVARSQLHKLLKGGDVPYEDEKFSYIAFSRSDIVTDCGKSRILRHPVIQKGFVGLHACTKEGIRDIKITRKDGELFKRARKSGCGDLI